VVTAAAHSLIRTTATRARLSSSSAAVAVADSGGGGDGGQSFFRMLAVEVWTAEAGG
jgi:hypothetical protein